MDIGTPVPTAGNATAEGLTAGAFAALGRLLRQEDPAAAEALRRDHPHLLPLLADLKVLGGPDPDDGGRPSGTPEEGLAQLARLGLSAAHGRVERLLAVLPRRARRAKRLKLLGGVVSAASSAGVVSALALAQPVAALASACLSLVTSTTALVGEHIESPLFGARKSIGELMSEALAIEQEARDAEIALLEIPASPDGAAAAAKLARKANEIAARLRVLEIIEGVRVPGGRATAG